MSKIQKIWLIVLVLLMAGVVGIILKSDHQNQIEVSSARIETPEDVVHVTKSDLDTEAGEAIVIQLDGDDTLIKDDGAEYDQGRVTIYKAGTYYLTGALTQGSIWVDVFDDEVVHLVLDNVSVSSYGEPALYVKTAGKVVVTSEAGSVNVFQDSTVYNRLEEVDACIYSNGNLTFNGEGALSVWGYYKDGIVSKGMIKFMEGNYDLRTTDDGIRGRDGILIQDGNFQIQSEGTCLKATQNTNAEKGNVMITGGSFSFIGGEHIISAVRNIVVQDCDMVYRSILEPFSCQEQMNIDEECIVNEYEE